MISKNLYRTKVKEKDLATEAHTVIKKDPDTGKVTHYETYKPQTNPRNPNAWESENDMMEME